MGSKKRSSDSLVEEKAVGTGTGELSGKDDRSLAKKKLKKQKDGKSEDASNPMDISDKPMERRKKRKALDKGRHRISLDSDDEEEKPNKQEADQSSGPLKTSLSLTKGSNLPEFHISVFSDLSSIDSSKREAAVAMLVSELVEVQRAYEKISDKEEVESGSMLEAEKDDGLDDCAPSVRYAVRRLIRGVSSSRECARQGFALGLAALVGMVPKIKVDSMLKLIDDSFKVSSSMKGQEAKDCLLGRLFAFGALARSGRLSEEWNSNDNTPYIKEVTSHLISLASRKRYLQEPTVSILLTLVDMLPSEAAINHVLEDPGLRKWLAEAPDAGNPDALLLALKLQEKISADSEIFGKLLPHPFSPHGLFAVDHLSLIANCLKEATFCQPRVHGVWPVLVSILLPDTAMQDDNAASSLTSGKKHKKNHKPSSTDEDVAVKNFCEVILEGSLLLSSHDRKHLAFDLLLLMLPRLPASCVPIVLSHKFVRCLMDVLLSKDSWLHKLAEHFLKELVDWVRHDDIRRVYVIVALQKHSSGRFDCITRTKTIKELMASFTTEPGCMLFIQKLTSMFVDEDHMSDEPSDQSQTTDENSEIGSVEDKENAGTSRGSDLLKTWIVESLPSILKQLQLEPEAKFRVEQEVVKFLAVQGLFSASLGTEVTSFELQEKFKWPRTAISNALSKVCIEQLELLLSGAQKGGAPSETNSLEKNDLGYFFMNFLGILCSIPSVSLFRSLDTEDEGAFKKLQAAESRLSREARSAESGSDTTKIHALRYLLIQLVLQLLLRPGELSEAAIEMVICIGKDFGFTELIESSGDEESDDSPNPLDVQLDTLLSLLPQASAPMRFAVEQVFKGMSKDITDDGLLRMLRIIKKDLKPARHRTDGSEDDDDVDDLLDIEEDEDSDVAEMGEDGEDVEDDEHTDDGTKSLGATGGDDNPESSDESDDDMDDDAMFRMDSYLAKIFLEKKNQAGGDTAMSQLNLFKLRVLSLLEIYLHENPETSQVLLIYSNLAQTFVNPNTMESSEQLGQRIWGILQKMFRSKKFPKSDIELATMVSLLEKNMRLASKPHKKKKAIANLSKKKRTSSLNRHKMIVSLAQNSTHWMLKVIDACKLSESELNKVYEVFENAAVAYFDSKKSQMKPEFLSEVFKRRPWVGHHLFGFLMERCKSAKFDYRRVEALDMLFGTLKSLLSDRTEKESRNILKTHLTQISDLVQILLKNMPDKQAKRAVVRKFCTKIFEIVSTHEMAKTFLKTLDADAQSACESQLGETFAALKKGE